MKFEIWAVLIFRQNLQFIHMFLESANEKEAETRFRKSRKSKTKVYKSKENSNAEVCLKLFRYFYPFPIMKIVIKTNRITSYIYCTYCIYMYNT
jgi:hypothetical protein